MYTRPTFDDCQSGGPMNRCAAVSSLSLLLCSAAFAAPPSLSSLKGTYAIQTTQAQAVFWSKTVSVTCPGVTYTATLGGQAADNVIIAGTITFSGAGSFSFNA